jgi:hypothetical protein
MGCKCKASGGIATGCHVNRKFTADDERSTDCSKSDNYKPDVAEHPTTTSNDEASDTEPEEDINLAYASTEAMGDADCEVSILSSL